MTARSSFDKSALLQVLERCRQLVSQSEDSDWSCLDVAAILAKLDRSLGALDEGSSIEIIELRFLFVVAGPLQETSMSNGWAKEFLSLAARFDEIIGETS